MRLPTTDHPLALFNRLLSFVIVLLAVSIFAWPFMPEIKWWASQKVPAVASIQAAPVVPEVPGDNYIAIPSIGLQTQIYEGAHADTLNKGVWHRPASSSPPLGGNTVLAGHRFTYGGESVFYHLDKVSNGDQIDVQWEGKKYQYQVINKFEVTPSAQEIEQSNSNEPSLTVYTCTPIWSAKNRLVLQAKLIGIR